MPFTSSGRSKIGYVVVVVAVLVLVLPTIGHVVVLVLLITLLKIGYVVVLLLSIRLIMWWWFWFGQFVSLRVEVFLPDAPPQVRLLSQLD